MTPQQTATIRAALRYWQWGLRHRKVFTTDWPEHFTDHEALSVSEIDVLCEELKINKATQAQLAEARETYGNEGWVEIDDDAIISPVEDGSCWIQGWLWLENTP